MDNIDKIKSVPIENLLKKLWVRFNNRKYIYDNWKYSDSYIYNTKNNIVTNFNQAKEWRPQWNPLNFYIQYTWQNVHEAIDWFNSQSDLNLNLDIKKPIEEVIEIKDEDRLASYLFLRWIDLKRLPSWLVWLTKSRTYGKDAPKEITQCLSIIMRDIKGKKTWYQYRSLLWKWFHTNGNDWLFWSFTKDLKKDYVFLVEWATDFLTIRQWTEQVIWFKSASAKPDEEIVAFINKFNKIYLLFDNDAAGKKCKEQFRESIESDIYEIEEEEDMNELGKQLWDWLVDAIIASAIQTKERTFALIDYSEWLDRWYKELMDRTESSVMSRWFEKFDAHMWYILPWQLTVVWWVTWVGKSTICNQIANNVARQWFRVARYSLEDRLEENRINDIYYEVNNIRTRRKDSMPSHSKFEAKLFTEEEYQWIFVDIQTAVRNLTNYNKNIIDLAHKKMVDIHKLENLFKDVVINKWVSLVIIDHLHYVKFEKNERHDLAIENFMHQLNDLLRKYKVSCILVSHYRKLQKDEEPDNNSFKDGAAIAQVANKVIHIDNDREEVVKEWEGKSVKYIITKNRGKSWLWVIFGRFHNGRIIMWESTLSKERRERKKLWFNFK